MSISTTTNRASYTGNGATVAFSFPYKFLADADLKVVVTTIATGVEVTKTLTTHYTVAGATLDAGGTVTMLTAPTALEQITIYRDAAATQTVDYRENDSFPAETTENAFDKLTMLSQRLFDLSTRTSRLSDGYVGSFDPTLPVGLPLAPGAVTIVNPAGTGFIVGPLAADISGATASAAAAAASAATAASSASASSTSSTLASQWATETTALVAATDNSAKAYAIGGTGAGQPTSGDAKSWAQLTGAAVIAGLYSAKEWATGVFTRGLASGGSAKDWANYISGTVDNVEYSAKYYANAASAYVASILSNNNTWTGTNTYQGKLFYQSETNAAATGAAASLTVAKLIQVLTNASLTSINNIASPTAGQILILMNQTGASVTVTNDSGGTAAERIKTGTGLDLLFKNNASLFLAYDTVTSRWQVVGGAGGSDATDTSSLALAASGGTIAVTTGILDQVVRVQGNSVEAVLSSTPFSGTPTNLTLMTLIGVSDDYPVTVPYNDGANGCVGNFDQATGIVLYTYQTARFRYISAISRWVYVR